MADSYTQKGVAQENDPAIGATAFAAATDYTSLAGNVRGFYVSTAGALQCTLADGSTATFPGLLAGVVYPIKITAITGAGTTATGFVLR